MAAHEVAAIGVEKDEEARGVAKGDQLGLLRVEVYRQGLKISNLLASHGQTVDPPSEVVVKL
jgi:hypothetical protein